MKLNRSWLIVALVLITAIGAAACKSSGVAVTKKGQALAVDVDLPNDLAEGETAELKVRLANRGVNNIGNIVVEVEVPNELFVVSKSNQGTELAEERTLSGSTVFYYHITELNITKEASITYNVQAKFGTADRSGDVKVTAYQKDLPGDKLHETKFVRVRR